MNKVITINLNGNAFQLEEGGYELLRAYLDGAARRLAGNPDRDEIIADIEQAIADKCRALLASFKTVVVTKEVQQVIDEMGPVENAAAETDEASAGNKTSSSQRQSYGNAQPGPGATDAASGTPRRLYKIQEGAMVRGVCNGLAAYFNIDVTLVRIAFVLVTCFWGTGILVYIVLALILPTADTAAERAAAQGMPATAQEFIHRAREGYYEGLKTLSDKHAHREWRRRFHQEMRGWKRMFRHEARANRYHWRYDWWNNWTPPAPGVPPPVPPPMPPGAWIALPFLSLIRGALVLLFVFAMVSLLNTGAVYGVDLPSGIPVWGGLLILLFAYKFVAWPFKAMRRTYYYGGGCGSPPVVWAFEALIGVGIAIAFVLFASHHWPEIQDALRAIPSVVHQGVDAVRDWWRHR